MATIEQYTRPRGLLRISDLDPNELKQLLDLAASMKAKPRRWCKPLRTETLVCLFEKPSTRTRVSFAVFLHCLPAHRGEEVTASVIDGPASVVWQQAANRLPTEQALIYALITGWWDGAR